VAETSASVLFCTEKVVLATSVPMVTQSYGFASVKVVARVDR